MKIIKSLILTLVLAGATYAGDMMQPAAPPPPGDIEQPLAPLSSVATPADQQTTQDAVTEMLFVIIDLLPLY